MFLECFCQTVALNESWVCLKIFVYPIALTKDYVVASNWVYSTELELCFSDFSSLYGSGKIWRQQIFTRHLEDGRKATAIMFWILVSCKWNTMTQFPGSPNMILSTHLLGNNHGSNTWTLDPVSSSLIAPCSISNFCVRCMCNFQKGSRHFCHSPVLSKLEAMREDQGHKESLCKGRSMVAR